ncbi:MAG: response regulator transcription factor [Candidatus Dormibacteraceae bacterium]
MAGELILIVDDEPSIRKLLSGHLLRRGYQVVVARDGTEALRFFEEETPNLLITDVNMPRLGGLDLLRQLKAAGLLGPKTATMIISGTKSLAPTRGDPVAVDDSLTKPIDMAEFSLRVKRVLRLAAQRAGAAE